MVVRGRPVHAGKRGEPVKLTRRTDASGNFRGSSGGMLWRAGIVVLETRGGVVVEMATGPYKETKVAWADTGVGGVHSTCDGHENITYPEGRDPALFE